MAATLLQIHDVLKAIQRIWAILDFTILAQYVLYDDKMFCYMKHALYKLEKIKIAFEHHRPINSKLGRLIFDYPKFHVISHFV